MSINNVKKILSGFLILILVFCGSFGVFAELPQTLSTDGQEKEDTVASPVTDGQEIIVKPGGEGYSESKGWMESALPDYDGSTTRYAYGSEEASWMPVLASGNYSVYVWRVVHETSDSAAEYTVIHNGKTTLAYADFTKGAAEWVLLGTYDFSGEKGEGVVYKHSTPNGVKRVGSMKFVPTTAEAVGSVVGEASADTPLVIVTPGGKGYSEEGTWQVSDQIKDYNDGNTRYAVSTESVANWLPRLSPGNYQVSVWKNVHETSHKAQSYTILHNGKADLSANVDFSSGQPGWVVLGVYDFSGQGREGVILDVKSSNGVKRATSVKFEQTDKAVTSGIYSDIAGTAYVHTVSILSALNILQGYEDGSFKPENEVTRAEFAAIMGRMTGYAQMWETTPAESSFDDVPASHWAAGYIAGLSEMGIVNGYDNKTFGPDDAVTYEQALKILLNILGYGVKAENWGGYPLGYLRTAADLRMDKAVQKKSGNLSRGDTAVLVLNALNTEVMTITGAGEKITYAVTEGKTLLWSVFQVKSSQGIFNADDFTDIYGDTGNLKQNEIAIDKIAYSYEGGSDLLGHYVAFYYHEDPDTNAKTVLYLYDDQGDNQESAFEIALESVASFDDGTLRYEKDGRILQAEISDEAAIVYNGSIGTGINLNNLLKQDNKNGSIKCIDTDEDGAFDVVIITCFYSFVIEGINAQAGKFFAKDSKLVCAELKPKRRDINYRFIKYGRAASLSDLSEWSVASIAVDDINGYNDQTGVLDMTNAKKITVYISDNYVSGSLDGRDSENLIIGQKKYAFDAHGYRLSEDDIRLGDTGDFLMDYTGKVVGVRLKEGEASYGYLVKVMLSPKKLTPYLQMRLFTLSGEMEDFESMEKITFGEQQRKAADVFTALAPGGVTANQIIKYTTNAAGKVTHIYTAEDNTGGTETDSDNDFSLNERKRSFKYNGESQSLMFKYYLAARTVIFSVPSNPEDYSDYEIGSIASFVDGESYTVDVYNVDRVRTPGFIVNYKGGNEAAGPALRWDLFVVNRVSEILDKNKDVKTAISGLINGAETTYPVVSDNPKADLRGYDYQYDLRASDLKTGDIIQVNVNAAGEIRDFRVLMRENEYTGAENLKWKYSNASPGYRGENFYLTSLSSLYGKVVKKSSNMLAVQTNDDRGVTYHKTTGSVKYYRYSLSQRRFATASYDEVGLESAVFIRYTAGLVKEIIIIEE